jgi:flagellar capping protein FliD
MKHLFTTRLLKRCLFGTFAAALTIATTVNAANTKSGYYKWTDDAGKAQFTQTPPEGRPSVFVATATGAQTSSRDAEPEVKATAATTPSGTPSGNLDGKMESLPQADPAKCSQAKANLNSLKSKARIRLTSPDGTQRFITDEERNSQIKLAEENIGVHCGK